MSARHSENTDGAEGVFPYVSDPEGGKTRQVEQMFDTIAPAYDRMNRAMTFGLCRRWREQALKGIAGRLCGADVLDVATGTGDVAFRIAEHYGAHSVTGADLSEGMLEVARRRLSAGAPAGCKISFDKADCLALPYSDASFDVVTVAYGVRNFSRLSEGLSEILRVLKPGGLLCIIELAEPSFAPVRAAYRLYSRLVIPLLGGMMSGDRAAYSYLPRSIAAAPQRDTMCQKMTGVGFVRAKWRGLFPGTVCVYTAEAPDLAKKY